MSKDRKLSICLLGDTAAHHLRRWAVFYADRGHEVNIISLNHVVLPGYSNVKIHVVHKKFPGPHLISRLASAIPGILAVRQLIAELNPDIVHAHSACGYAWNAMWSGKRPIVISPWGSDILEDIKVSKLAHFLTSRALKQADLVHTDGDNVLEEIKQIGVPDEKIVLLRYGVNVERFKPPVDKNSAKQALGYSGRYVVVSTRTLTPVHNVQTVLDAISESISRRPEMIFVILGDGSDRKTLEEKGKRYIESGHLVFVGAVSEDNMIRNLQAADLYVSMSLYESGLASSTGEAMACGLPILNSDTGDIRNWIRDGVNGFVLPAKDSVALADKIREISSDATLAAAISANNRERIVNDFNFHKEMTRFETKYFELAGKI